MACLGFPKRLKSSGPKKLSGEAKKAQTEKADKSVIWAFVRHKYKES